MKAVWAALRHVLPAWVHALAPRSATARRVAASPDRDLLVRELFFTFARRGNRILWVGVKRYTADYPARMQRFGAEVWTLDIDPGNAAWGAEGRHVTGDLLHAAEIFGEATFDKLMCNGVFGFGVDTPEMQDAAFEAMAKVIKPGGWLLLGWNTDRTADPLVNPAFSRWFTPRPLGFQPKRQFVPKTTHVYDIARRKGHDDSGPEDEVEGEEDC